MLGEIRMGGLAKTSSMGLKEVLSIQMKGSTVYTDIRIKKPYRTVRVATERSFIRVPSLHSDRCRSPAVL
jgi:hypothetical protein